MGVYLKVVEDEKSFTGRSGNIVCHKLHDAKHGKATVLDFLRLILDCSLALDLGAESF